MNQPTHIVNLKHNHGFQWASIHLEEVAIWVKGFAFCSEILYRGQEFATLILKRLQNSAACRWEVQLKQLLLDINGSFSFVVQGAGCLWATVDRMRSMPLFYGVGNDARLFLSDDAHWIREQVEDVEPTSLSVKEFLLAGYVTGPNTLFPRVKQLQAGEYFWCKSSEVALDFKTQRYYRWLHGDYSDATEEELCAEMDRMHLRVFERLLASTKGRTIVVPLSGGYDSRLIVTMLKRLGYEDVICFSYGRPGNWEAEISQQVAKSLGYPWLFVPYSYRRWRKWFQSEERQSYSRLGSGLNSIAVIQDFPAVWELSKKQRIPSNAVWVPGHSGDFVAGSHIPKQWRKIQEGNSKLLLEGVKTKLYYIWPVEYNKFYEEFGTHLLKQFDSFPCETIEQIASIFEYCDWQERQSKFIVNSVRAYEHWGYEWRLPLWDNDVMSFWRRVPLTYRIHKALYDKCVERLFGEFEVGCECSGGTKYSNTFINRAINLYDKLSDPRFGRYSIGLYLQARNCYANTFPASICNSFSSALNVSVLGAFETVHSLTSGSDHLS